MVLVFAWWLYSFINLVSSEYKLEKENLKLTEQVIQEELINAINFDLKSSDSNQFKLNTVQIYNSLKTLNSIHQIKTNLIILDSTLLSKNPIKVEATKQEFQKIEKRYKSKKRAYYSEVIFFGFLVIGGSFWIFKRLESLLNVNKMQNNFLLSVTHELKTPITAIKLSTETVLKRKLEETLQHQILNQTLLNSERLNSLVDNVLLTTNIDSGLYEFKNESIHLEYLIDEISKEVLNESNFNGQFKNNISNLTLNGDILALKMVFSNLINNALKYAGENAQITVNHHFIDGKNIVSVDDNGKGIDKKDVKYIFDKFYRTGNENTRETKGTGLGLYIVKEILKLHKAKIEYKELKPHGSSFIITFK